MPNDRRRNDRGLLNYYAPLAFTVTVAAIGIAAWVWKERNDNDGDEWDDRGDHSPPAPDYSSNVPPGHAAYAAGPGPGPDAPSDDPNMFARMQGALRRTPSPQQIFDGASKKVAAGVAAAGAMVGGALSSIREEDGRHYYEDHSRWSEEAEARKHEQAQATLQTASMPPQVPSLQRAPPANRKTVAIVLSADSVQHDADQGGFHTEHASILSHLPEHVDAESRVFILIYAPGLKQHPIAASSRIAPSIASSYSHIDQADLQTPNEEMDRPLTTLDPTPAYAASPSLQPEGASDMFRALYQQAQTLVERDTMIMPFTTPTGYVHLVRHITPHTVYVQSNLSGPGGDAVKHISGWVGEVVLVVGDETGHGGLVDSEDERAGGASGDQWWQTDPAVGLGKGIDVVEGLRMGEDWRRRVKGHD